MQHNPSAAKDEPWQLGPPPPRRSPELLAWTAESTTKRCPSPRPSARPSRSPPSTAEYDEYDELEHQKQLKIRCCSPRHPPHRPLPPHQQEQRKHDNSEVIAAKPQHFATKVHTRLGSPPYAQRIRSGQAATTVHTNRVLYLATSKGMLLSILLRN